MFDFFKDMYLAASGLDMEKVREERKEKIELEKNEKIILSKQTKKYMVVFGVVFILIHVLSACAAFMMNDIIALVKSVIMVILALLSIICFLQKTKKAEIGGIVFLILIVLLTFAIPALK